MSALLQLSKALKRGSTLAWVLKYAPDGDRDAALARAWNAEQNVRTLGKFAWDFHPLAHEQQSNGSLVPLNPWCLCRRPKGERYRRRYVCEKCVHAARGFLRPPTWAEVEK